MGERSGAPSGFSPASIVISKPPVAVQLPQPDVSANRDAPHIDVQVDVLVVETEQVFNLRALGNWRRITPHDVLDDLVAHPSRPVARHSLIRAARDVLGGG